MTKPVISIVLPSYNEEMNVVLVHDKILENLDLSKYAYEMIFINDGSKDGTWKKICQVSKADKFVTGINFSRNFGHHAALQAGLETAKGDVVIMMDADLQHPPKLIPQLIDKWERGYDIVNTVRISTENVGVIKKITAKAFYKILNMISDLQLNEGEADFRLINRAALNALNGLPESPKFYRGLVNWVGFKVGHIKYHAEARLYGKSSYTLHKMIELARLGLTSFSMKPLKFIISFGISLSIVSFLGLCAMLITKFIINSGYFSNNAILVMFLIFVSGVLSTFQGIVAIYLVDIFEAAKGRPSYIISSRVGDDVKN